MTDLREVLAAVPAGVVVVAAVADGGRRGLTATSFVPVSLEPPLILVSIEELTATGAAVQSSGRFSVTLLGRSQEFIAERFAGRAPAVAADWRDVPHRASPGGLPWIDGAVAWFECALERSVPAGDHQLLIGSVLHAERSAGEPLVHWDRSFWRLA